MQHAPIPKPTFFLLAERKGPQIGCWFLIARIDFDFIGRSGFKLHYACQLVPTRVVGKICPASVAHVISPTRSVPGGLVHAWYVEGAFNDARADDGGMDRM